MQPADGPVGFTGFHRFLGTSLTGRDDGNRRNLLMFHHIRHPPLHRSELPLVTSRKFTICHAGRTNKGRIHIENNDLYQSTSRRGEERF